jgi:hypothetical protein
MAALSKSTSGGTPHLQEREKYSSSGQQQHTYIFATVVSRLLSRSTSGGTRHLQVKKDGNFNSNKNDD